MRKFLAAIILTFALMLGQSNAQAYNYDCGIFPASGLHGYLMTETISKYYGGFRCTVVCYPSGRPYYINYRFWLANGAYYFENSDGYSDRVSGYTPVELNVCNAVI